MSQLVKILTLSTGLALAWALAFPAAAFTGQDEETPGFLALRYQKKSHVWSRLDLGYVDAQSKTSPPGSVRFDRRLEAFAELGFDAVLQPRLGLRLNIKANQLRQRQSQRDLTQAVIDKSEQVYTPSLDLTFVNDQGLELFAGAEDGLHAAYQQSITSANGSSSTHVHKANVLAPHFGIVRRAGAWSGGFYYGLGGHAKRDVDQSAFDGSGISSQDIAFIPPKLGVMGTVALGKTQIDSELGFVQARNQGVADDQGRTLYSDYFQTRFGVTSFFGNFGLKASAFYQTQSYDSSAYVTIDTMPLSALKLLILIGTESDHTFFGLTSAYGKDGQSQAEFNAFYRMLGLAATTGLFFTL